MGNDPKHKPGGITPMDAPDGALAMAPAHRKPIIGDRVHFFDQNRAGPYARMGVGPYAATVTCIDGGVALFVMGPQGGRFDVDKVPHKSEISGEGKKRWWEWPRKAD